MRHTTRRNLQRRYSDNSLASLTPFFLLFCFVLFLSVSCLEGRWEGYTVAEFSTSEKIKMTFPRGGKFVRPASSNSCDEFKLECAEGGAFTPSLLQEEKRKKLIRVNTTRSEGRKVPVVVNALQRHADLAYEGTVRRQLAPALRHEHLERWVPIGLHERPLS